MMLYGLLPQASAWIAICLLVPPVHSTYQDLVQACAASLRLSSHGKALHEQPIVVSGCPLSGILSCYTTASIKTLQPWWPVT